MNLTSYYSTAGVSSLDVLSVLLALPNSDEMCSVVSVAKTEQ